MGKLSRGEAYPAGAAAARALGCGARRNRAEAGGQCAQGGRPGPRGSTCAGSAAPAAASPIQRCSRSSCWGLRQCFTADGTLPMAGPGLRGDGRRGLCALRRRGHLRRTPRGPGGCGGGSRPGGRLLRSGRLPLRAPGPGFPPGQGRPGKGQVRTGRGGRAVRGGGLCAQPQPCLSIGLSSAELT